MASSSECENENPLHNETHAFLEAYLEHVPDLQEYAIILIGTHPNPDDPEKILVSATKHATEGMATETVKTLVEALVNLLVQERFEDETAYATRH